MSTTTSKPARTVTAPENTPAFRLRTANSIVGGVALIIFGQLMALFGMAALASASSYSSDRGGYTMLAVLGVVAQLVGVVFALVGWHQRLQAGAPQG